MGRSGQTPRKSAICASGAMARSFMTDREHRGLRLEIVEQGKSFLDIGQETPQKHLQGKLDGPDTVIPGWETAHCKRRFSWHRRRSNSRSR